MAAIGLTRTYQADESSHARELSGGFAKLRFEQPLETKFRVHHLAESLGGVRLSLLVGLIFMGTLGFLDWRLLPGELHLQNLVIRLGIIAPVLLACLLATYSRFLTRYVGRLLPFTAIVLSAATLAAM